MTSSPSTGPSAGAGEVTGAVPIAAGSRVLLFVDIDADDDAGLRGLAARLDVTHDVTLVHVRPSAPSAAPHPPYMLMGDLGVIAYGDWPCPSDDECRLDASAAARSARLRDLGIAHSTATVIYPPSLFTRRNRRHRSRAIQEFADHARADVVVVGPGAILGPSDPPLTTRVGDRHFPSEGLARADESPTPEATITAAARRDESRRMIDDLWIDVGGSG